MMLGKAVGVFPNLTSWSSLMFEGLYYSANCPEDGGGGEKKRASGKRNGGREKERNRTGIHLYANMLCFKSVKLTKNG